MAVKKFGVGLIVTGATGILIALLIFLFRGSPETKPISIFVMELSLIIALLGAWFRTIETIENVSSGKLISNLIAWMLNWPIVVWVSIGFLLVYLLLFLWPVFLNSGLQMNYFNGYIPNLNPIGNDLIVMLDQIKGWVATNQSPYQVQFYPPLTYVLFAPWLLIQEYPTLYRLFTLFTFLSYCLLTLWLPLRMMGKKHVSLVLLLFVTGLFSYGFQFELERGQYNVFTFFLCLSSIYIFHYHPRYRLLAYVLFSLSIQLKLYPAIFVVMFVDNWRDWKNILLRFVGLGIFNLMLFFAMGPQIFLDFIRSVTAQIVNPSWIGPWNHSISSFVSVMKQDGFGLVSLESLRIIRHNATWIETGLLLIFIILFAVALVISSLRKGTTVDPYLLLTCAIGALILPISYDYTLSILAAPVLLFFSGIAELRNSWLKGFSIFLILGIALAYFAMLIPSNYRPHVLMNTFPCLFVILILATILNFIQYQDHKLQAVSPQ